MTARTWHTYIFRTAKGFPCRYAWRISRAPIDPGDYLPWVDLQAPERWGFVATQWGARRAIRRALRGAAKSANLVQYETVPA